MRNLILTICLALALMPVTATAQGTWESVGPEFVMISAMGIDNTGVIYIGGLYSSLMYTPDEGDNWYEGDGWPWEPTCFVGSNTGTVFCGDSEPGLWRTMDHGPTWLWDDAELPEYNGVRTIAVSPTNDHVYAGFDGDGVYLSTDDGLTWVTVNNGLTDLGVRALTCNNLGHIFAATWSGIFRSTDDGANWTLLANPLGSYNVMAVGPDQAVFVGGDGPYRSTDNGDTWVQVDNGLGPPPLDKSDKIGLLEVNAIAFTSVPGKLYVGMFMFGVSVSQDNGDSWTENNNGLTELDVVGLVVNDNDEIFAATYGSGVFKQGQDLSGAGERELPGTRFTALGQNYPNPFNPRTVIPFSLSRSGFVTLKLYDLSGREVKTVLAAELGSGPHEIAVDGADLASGIYLCRLNTGWKFLTRRITLVR